VTIAELATDKNLKAFARKYAGDYADDLIQDAILILLQLEKGRVEQIHEQGSLCAYAKQIIYNIRHGKGNSETVTDINHITGIGFEHLTTDETTEDDARHELLIEGLKRLYWYERDLFTLYCQLGSARKVEEATGINYVSVSRTVKKVKHELRTFIIRGINRADLVGHNG
jgi:RNA polymerase sigma factor (sigma-70 family)